VKAVLWIVALAAAAVGLVLAARQNPGYALFVFPPYRLEVSLNLLAVLLLGGFALAYALARFVSVTVRLPQRVREFRAARRRERAREALLEALKEYFTGRLARAEQAAARALELGEQPVLGAVLAARAAHGLRAHDRRDGYLARAAACGQDETLRVMTEVELMLEERRYREALEALERLPRKHTAALRLALRAQQQARNWEQVIALLGELERRKGIEPTQAAQLRRQAYVEWLRRSALDVRALEEAWSRVPEAERTDHRVAAAAARAFVALGECARAQRVIEQALEADWDSALVALYAECRGPDTVRRIERAEAWLRARPSDAALLLALGRLCAQQELWGKAQSYLEASLALERTHSAHLALAQLHERLGRPEEARRHYRDSLDLALAQLREATGGRRRVPL
jgi:HemY protein